jgi:hypothetical protein
MVPELRVSVAASFAATMIALGLCAPAACAESGDSQATLLLFSGTDLWRDGSFVHGGLLWSPDGLNDPGFTLKAAVSGGAYRYVSGGLGNIPVIGRELTAQFMPGWRFKWFKTEVKIFAGLDLQHHRLRPDDPTSGLRGGSTGVRAAVEFWSEPGASIMLAADAAISTIAANNYTARLAAGWQPFDSFYLGPEWQAFASDNYRQRRFGVHVTGIKLEWTEWSAAAGWASDSDDRSSLYFRFGVLQRM